jgi:hypothetical protein
VKVRLMSIRKTLSLMALMAGSALASPLPVQDVSPRSLSEGFQNPPASARPRVWWHWLNGNVTGDGIDKDLDWIARMGIGGVQNLTPIWPRPRSWTSVSSMQPDWKEAFRHAVITAETKGLEFTIASSPGWSQTGPWVRPEDGMKKLVWSQTSVAGRQRFHGRLADLPHVTGPYQNLPSAEPFASGAEGKLPEASGQVAVLAVPLRDAALPAPVIAGGGGVALIDDDLETTLDLPISSDGVANVKWSMIIRSRSNPCACSSMMHSLPSRLHSIAGIWKHGLTVGGRRWEASHYPVCPARWRSNQSRRHVSGWS